MTSDQQKIAEYLQLDLSSEVLQILYALAGKTADADFALQSFAQWQQADDSKAIVEALQSQPDMLRSMLQVFAWCEVDAQWIHQHIISLDAWKTEILHTRPSSHDDIRQCLQEVLREGDLSQVKQALRHVHRRETLRILVLDLNHDLPPEKVARHLSDLADALMGAALQAAIRLHWPKDLEFIEGHDLGLCVLAFGKLGGRELNYSSDIDLVFVHQGDLELPGQDGSPVLIDNSLLTRMVVTTIDLLHDRSADGHCYRVDSRLRPDGANGPLTRSATACFQYYIKRGRVWERQALLKARAAAGDIDTGDSLLQSLQGFVFQRELEYTSIREIKALKRRIEERSEARQEYDREIKTGYGGIRDIEFSVQFLQLIHGVDHEPIRTPSTFEGIRQLEYAHCINHRDAVTLMDGYNFLRKLEHRLQVRRHLQTHVLPETNEDQLRVARIMGYQQDSLNKFKREHQRHRREVRKTLNRILHRAFELQGDASGTEIEWLLSSGANVTDLQLTLDAVGFSDPDTAMELLHALAEEQSEFLPPNPEVKRAFANIVTPLLQRLRQSQQPDAALLALQRCIHSLGGRQMLYQLFAENSQTLDIFVDLAMWSPPLVAILTREPGILDQVMDSLMISRYKSLNILQEELQTMLPGFATIEETCIAFKNQELLRIGIRDLQHTESLLDIMTELSDLAECILRTCCEWHYQSLCKKHGTPDTRFVILGLGKLGGREMNYNSDLDVFCLYENNGELADGMEYKRFFKHLMRNLFQSMSCQNAQGQLYDIDARLRPDGSSGSLVTSFARFQRYHTETGNAQLWEKQALLRARFCAGDETFGQETMTAIRSMLQHLPDRDAIATALRDMRSRIESGQEQNLKKGLGGLVDIEFTVQFLQLLTASTGQLATQPNTYLALQQWEALGVESAAIAHELSANYLFLRRMENRIRIATTLPADLFPVTLEDAEQLARRMGWEGEAMGELLLQEIAGCCQSNREHFDAIVK